jgi:hypothetical protein
VIERENAKAKQGGKAQLSTGKRTFQQGQTVRENSSYSIMSSPILVLPNLFCGLS